MRFAAIADVHGNYLALEAVIADIRAQDITDIVNLGDMASGPLDARRWQQAGFGKRKTKRPSIRRPPLKSIAESRSDRSGDPLLQLLLRRGTDLAGGHLAALEDHQGRDRHHTVFRGRLRALVDVELYDLDLVAHRA